MGRGGSPQGCPWPLAGCTRSPSLPPGPSLSLAVVTNSPGQYGHPGGTRGSPVRKEGSWDRQDEGPPSPPRPHWVPSSAHSQCEGCTQTHCVSPIHTPDWTKGNTSPLGAPISTSDCMRDPYMGVGGRHHHPRLEKGPSPPYPLYVSIRTPRWTRDPLSTVCPLHQDPAKMRVPPSPPQIHSMAPLPLQTGQGTPYPHHVLPISILYKARDLPQPIWCPPVSTQPC